MKRTWLFFLLAAAVCLPLFGCHPGPAPRKLSLTGASTVAPLASELAKRYEEKHPDVRIDVQTGGSARGINDVRQDKCDIGMASRDLKEDEKNLLAFLIARDGICIILHKDNPVEKLSDEQVVKIYTRAITNWKEVGGPDAPITLVHKAEGRSTLELFLAYFKIEADKVKPDVVVGDNEQGIKTVSGNANAIGYVSIGNAEYDAKTGVPIKLLPCAGIAPTRENVRNRTFPIARPLNLVMKDEPTGLAKEFIEFAQSAENNDLVEKLFYVPVAK